MPPLVFDFAEHLDGFLRNVPSEGRFFQKSFDRYLRDNPRFVPLVFSVELINLTSL